MESVESQIAEWRAYVAGAPGVDGRDVDELEGHLRDQIADLHEAGLADDEAFLESLALIERAAADDRNFVKKGVSWAIRVMGRRNRTLNAACLETARRLVESDQPAARWIGRETVKELTGPVVRRKLRG